MLKKFEITNTLESLKENVKQKQILVIENDGKEIDVIEDIQPLYLFPLCITDYAKEIQNKQIQRVKLNIVSVDESVDYKLFFEKPENSNLKNVEFLVQQNYTEKQLKTIDECVCELSKKGVRITLLFEDVCEISDEFLKNCSSKTAFFKVMLGNILETEKFERFKEKLQIIQNFKLKDSLVLVKAYLDENESLNYRQAVIDFENLSVDIFQVSKTLLPLGAENKNVLIETQTLVRELEQQFDKNAKTTFLSVKDLTILFYPRFEIDERNSRKCFACRLKPFVFDKLVIPCKVEKVLQDKNKWKVADVFGNVNEEIFDLVGITCDDCASLFENDILSKIEDILLQYPNANLKIISEREK